MNKRPSTSLNELAGGKRFFVYAAPLKGARKTKRKPPKPPFRGAKPWQCSVYYFWWEYLRENEIYLRCCANGGRGKLWKLYRDFGDVRDDNFWAWWRTHDHLFSEPLPKRTEVVERNSKIAHDGYMVLAVPTDIPLALAFQQIKRLLSPAMNRPIRLTTDSQAKYPVATKPVLSSLNTHLEVWRARKDHPRLKLFEIADLVGLVVDETLPKELASDFKRGATEHRKDLDRILRKKKAVLVSRHLRIARQYIDGVGIGEFPKRDRR